MSAADIVRQIPVLSSTGTGGTSLAAFHDALVTVGLGHYNLIRLSSVVPPRTVIDGSGAAQPPAGSWGDRLYCVYGEQRAEIPGQQAWSGIGWVHRLDAGGGLLVEHEGSSEKFVTQAITTTLRDMIRSAPAEYGEPGYVVSGITCIAEPVCALVIAPFAVMPWPLSDFSETNSERALNQVLSPVQGAVR